MSGLRQDIEGERTKAGFGGVTGLRQDIALGTGLRQDKERDRTKIGYGGRLDSERIWPVTGLRQDLAGDRTEPGPGG